MPYRGRGPGMLAVERPAVGPPPLSLKPANSSSGGRGGRVAAMAAAAVGVFVEGVGSVIWTTMVRVCVCYQVRIG